MIEPLTQTPTSPIYGESGQSTRAADNYTIPLGPWFNRSEGTLYVEFGDVRNQFYGYPYYCAAGLVTTGQYTNGVLGIGHNNTTSGRAVSCVPGSAIETSNFPGGGIAGRKTAISFGSFGVRGAAGGNLAQLLTRDCRPTLGVVSQIYFDPSMAGIVKNIRYLSRAASDAELPVLTT